MANVSRRIHAITLFAALVCPGCLATAVRIPPKDTEKIHDILRGTRPGQGGVLLWHSRSGSSGIGEVLDALRATGIFAEVREYSPDPWYEEYDPAADPAPADWILCVEDLSGLQGEVRPEVPIATLLTFGIIPCIVREDFVEAFRLVHRSGHAPDSRVLKVPGRKGEVIGLLPAFLLSVHPDWHLFAVDATLRERGADRLVKEVLRAVVESTAR